MKGFKTADLIASNFRKIIIPELKPAVSSLEAASNPQEVRGAVKNFFTELMLLGDSRKALLIRNALEAGEKLENYRWIKGFSELYPGVIGIVSPLYLNIVVLHPGEAMYLPAGELHAYLEGTGIELMANSDNVLRGGLTPKHVDVPELLSTLSFSSLRPEIIEPVKISENESAYPTEAVEFYLSRIVLQEEEYQLPEAYGPELPSVFICLEGRVEISDLSGGTVTSVSVSRGDSAFADYGSRLRLKGSGLLYRASVPLLK
jgi:mannose-6-phosphate isomerase